MFGINVCLATAEACNKQIACCWYIQCLSTAKFDPYPSCLIQLYRFDHSPAGNRCFYLHTKQKLSFHQLLKGMINSLWPSDAIWWHSCGSALAEVMACCLMTPSHYLNQCWLDRSWVRPCGIHLRTISRQMLQISVLDLSLKLTDWGLHLYLQGINELTSNMIVCQCE